MVSASVSYSETLRKEVSAMLLSNRESFNLHLENSNEEIRRRRLCVFVTALQLMLLKCFKLAPCMSSRNCNNIVGSRVVKAWPEKGPPF